jgi:hypothetical protein
MARSALKGAVMRIAMGELEGRLRAIESSWDSPLICSSASSGSGHDGRGANRQPLGPRSKWLFSALSAGANLVVSKPDGGWKLIECVQRLLQAA